MAASPLPEQRHEVRRLGSEERRELGVERAVAGERCEQVESVPGVGDHIPRVVLGDLGRIDYGAVSVVGVEATQLRGVIGLGGPAELLNGAEERLRPQRVRLGQGSQRDVCHLDLGGVGFESRPEVSAEWLGVGWGEDAEEGLADFLQRQRSQGVRDRPTAVVQEHFGAGQQPLGTGEGDVRERLQLVGTDDPDTDGEVLAQQLWDTILSDDPEPPAWLLPNLLPNQGDDGTHDEAPKPDNS